MNNTSDTTAANASSCGYDIIDKKGNTWQPSFFRRAPWLGLIAMLGALIGVLAAIIVLYVSNNKFIDDSKIQPTVYLAIASAATNILLPFALNKAVTVAWWSRALQRDNTVADLHRSWEHGQSLWAALTSGRHFNALTLASILVAMVPVNGPLLQRASRIRQSHFESDTDVHVNIAQEIPGGYTGYLSTRGYRPTLLTPPFIQVVQEFNKRSPVSITNSGCKGSCNARISGAGLVANCSKSDSPFILGGTSGEDNSNTAQELLVGTTIFGAYLLWPANGYGLLQGYMMKWPVMTPGTFNLGVQYKGTEDCRGKLVVRNCTFKPATVIYPVTIDGNTSSISLAAGTTIFDDKLLNITAVSPVYQNTDSSFNISTYGGFFKALSDIYGSTLRMSYGAIGYQIFNEGSLSNQYLNASKYLKRLECSMSFFDPTDDIVAAIRELMFRTAMASANGQAADVQHFTAKYADHPPTAFFSLPHTLLPHPDRADSKPYRDSFNHPVYTSSYLFLALAVLFSLLGWIATLPIFLGWWHLGRAVSLSPIETAKAFGAPGLKTEDSNADAKGILKDVGSREVRYGAMKTTISEELDDEAKERIRLIIGEPRLVRSPKDGERFVG